jgi:phospholipid-binding lipoprotein MlaA
MVVLPQRSKRLRQHLRIASCVECARPLAGVHSRGGRPAPRDPFERFNRSVYSVNTTLDHAVLRPVARGSSKIPAPVSNVIRNFVSNLLYSLMIVNDFLQANFHDGANDVARVVVNTTVGLGGLFDPATAMRLDRNCEDLGLTLGKWGVPSGPYVMLPFLGPSTVRDTLGAASQRAGYLIVSGPAIALDIYGTDAIEQRAALLPTDALLVSAYDPYALERSMYLQERDFHVHPMGPVAEQTLAPSVPNPSADP